ncbi:MmcQ/YjbR family DNA-binding protein [Poseidonocella sp. HB161398]|uniref:MmcQ/YjbR family DNA-binding protein n=1 Tax=Poseidonocella sp. HB161398 TaxID=2320855 RepID=UPI001107CFE3|nr:MmcQ/YjbR family DNA-binding protein [Poseidonocella sp. HB161398]
MTGAEFDTLARGLAGSTARPHFDRMAYRVRRNFATLAADGQSANLCLSPEEQAHWCALLPRAFAPVPNKWAARGWTTVALAAIDAGGLRPALDAAWRSAGGQD